MNMMPRISEGVRFMELFAIKDIDKKVYEEELVEFLPDELIDIHTHVHSIKNKETRDTSRQVLWPSLVAKENTGAQLDETYKLMFPGKKVTPLIFTTANKNENFERTNAYIAQESNKFKFPALYFSMPWETGDQLEKKCQKGKFLGLKSYLSFSPDNIPESEIKIFDFFPHNQLETANKNSWIVMLHIPRHGRLRDPENLKQLLEIDEKYPNAKVIIAHIGRAYADIDAGDAFNVLSDTRNLLFDFSANTNENMIKKAIETFGTKRIMLGSDLPITRMRTRRIIRNNTYVNLVPKGLYGDMTGVPHMEEISGTEADKLTFFLYEEILAFKRAAIKLGLDKSDIKDIFYDNAKSIIEGAGKWLK